MASFVSPSYNFNPYVSQLPIEAMVTVGMRKEEEFKAGVQKVQADMDSISGLDIAKTEDRDYVYQRLGKLREGISKNLSGDFGDMRVTNQIGGAIKQIYKDPVVQNGVLSTATYRKGLADMETAKKAGKSSPANDIYFQDQANAWLSDKTMGTSFNGSYIPYTDKIDTFLKYWKEVNPTTDFEGDMTRINAKGEREINPVIFKGKNANQIQAVWDLVKADSNVQQQLQIDGHYQYRGQKPSDIYQSLENQAKATLERNNDLITTLQAKAATGDKQAAADIKSFEAQNKETVSSLSDFRKALETNPDAVKAALVGQQTLSSLIGAYTTKVMEKNPLWETSFEVSKWNIQMQQWGLTHNLAERKFEWEQTMDQANFNQKAEEIKAKKKAETGEFTPTALSPKEAIKSEYTARTDIAKAQDVYTQSMRELAFNLANAAPGKVIPPYYKDEAKGTWEPNVGVGKGYKTEGEANGVAKKFFDEAASSSALGTLVRNDKTLNDLYVKSQDKYNNLQSAKKIVSDVEAGFAPQMAELTKQISTETKVSTQVAGEFAKAYIVKHKLKGYESIEIGLKQQYGNDWETAMQIGVEPRGYGENVEFVPQALTSKFAAASKVLAKTTTLANLVQAKEIAYQERQKTPIGYTVTAPASANEATRTTYASIVGSVTDLNSGSNKGDHKKFEAALFGKEAELKQNLYSRYLNPNTGEAYLTVKTANDKFTISIPKELYLAKFPEESQYSAFREKFQTKLNLNRGMYTGTEFADAYQAYQGPHSPYIVKYNVIATGNGGYKLKWWVATQDAKNPNKTNMLIDGKIVGEQNGLNQEMSEEALYEATKKLEDKNWVEMNLAIKAKLEQ